MQDQIQAVFEANLISPLIRMLATAEYDIKKEAAWALSNATSGGTADQIRGLVDAGCIKPLCDTLTVNDTRIIIVALEGLENILKVRAADRRGAMEGHAMGWDRITGRVATYWNQRPTSAACSVIGVRRSASR